MPTRRRPLHLVVATLLPLCALALCALALPGAARAQDSAAAAPVSLVGEWRGTSICTPVGKPACHDEQVVYRVRRAAAAGTDSTVERLEWVMNKIVNGAEEDMATLDCEYRPALAQVSCPMRGWVWSFDAMGGMLRGTLKNPAGVVWRDIRVARGAK
jgi:hypothetical protein